MLQFEAALVNFFIDTTPLGRELDNIRAQYAPSDAPSEITSIVYDPGTVWQNNRTALAHFQESANKIRFGLKHFDETNADTGSPRSAFDRIATHLHERLHSIFRSNSNVPQVLETPPSLLSQEDRVQILAIRLANFTGLK